MRKKFDVNSKEEVKKWYEKKEIAGKYLEKRFEDPLGRLRHTKQIKVINFQIKKRKPKNVLDIACGPARITKDLKGKFKGLAVDNSDEMLNIAKKRLNLKKRKIKKVDAFNLKLNQKFDLIIFFRFVRHFKIDKRKIFYKEVHNLLNDGGIFIFDVVNSKKWHSINKLSKFLGRKPNIPVYDKFYTKEELKKELKENGFKIIKLSPLINWFLIEFIISNFFCFVRLNKLGFYLLYLIDKIRGFSPWEWVVIAKKD